MTAAALTLVDVEQRTPDWLALRVGKVTSSRITDVLARIAKGEAASRRNYRAEIVCETLTGVSAEDTYISREMQWGIDHERDACVAYELLQDVMVMPIGFAVHPFIERFGASPDGFVGDDGLVEIKCPNTSTHIDYMLAGIVPAEYEPQMLVAMACTGRAWCDFVSFDPRLPAHLQLFIRRFHRDEARIADIEGQVMQFLAEVDDVLVQLGAAAVSLPEDKQPPEARQRRILAEVKASLDFYFGGKLKHDLQVRTAACDLVFDVKSQAALDVLSFPQLERGLRILRAYEKFPKHDLSSPAAVLTQLCEAIAEHDRGASEEI
jgi:putative phage-type endonuclease